MAGSQQELDRAAATHRLAVALVAAAAERLSAAAGPPDPTPHRIHELAQRLRSTAALLAPGWLGGPLTAAPAGDPPRSAAPTQLVRIGTAHPLGDASFPVLVPLGHLSLDAAGDNESVTGLLRALMLRLLASARAGSLLVRVVDPAGDRFRLFAPLHSSGIMAPPATDRDGMRAVLTEAEQWVRARTGAGERGLLLVTGGWPAGTGPAEAARLATLAEAGPEAGLRLLVAGWPGTAEPGPPLPHATQVTVRDPYALVGDPPGDSFANPAVPHRPSSPGLNAPVRLDGSPPDALVTRVCAELAGRVADPVRLSLDALLPADPPEPADPATGLSLVLGHASGGPVRVRLADATPHWLVVGRSGSGRTALLLDILYGLCGRYGPGQVAVHLLDLGGHRKLAGFVAPPADLPGSAGAAPADPPERTELSPPAVTRPAALPPVVTGRADGLAVLRRLTGALAGRADGQRRPARVVCLVDEVGELLAGEDPATDEAARLLSTLARQGGPLGVHLVMASRDTAPPAVAAHCRVRIALPGGAAALDTANAAAAGLAPGNAVVNTASGLGGPRGATRAHERLVRFPDPYADRAALVGLGDRLWQPAAGTLPGGAR